MAVYAADIEVKIKNKGELTRLEKQFKKLFDVSVQLDKTIKSLGKSNVIKVDTRGAISAINQLETKIKSLSRTVNLDARTRESRSGGGGMSGAAIPMMAAAMNQGRNRPTTDSRIDLFKEGDEVFKKHIKNIGEEVKMQEHVVKSYGETAERAWTKHSKAVKNFNKHQEKTTRTLDELEKSYLKSNFHKFSKNAIFGKQAAKNFEIFAKAYIRTNSEVAELLQKQNKAVVDRVGEEKILKERAEGNLRREEQSLQNKKDVLRLTKEETENTINRALMTDRERELHRDINKHKRKGFEALAQSYRHQEEINEAIVQGIKPAKKLTDQLEESTQRMKESFDKVRELRQELNKPINTGPQGLIGGMRSLGIGGAKAAFGKGALGASAMVPGMAPFAIGAGAGAIGKSGGAMLAGGALGAAGAGVLMGGLALGNFIKEATIASSEMKKMQLALTAVVSSNEDYKNALDSVNEISNSLLIPQAKVTKAFTRLQAAASASGFEVNDVKNMMKGFSAALVATEGDTKNFNGVMLALGQVMGKGKAAAEEIRGQIGERLSVVIPELAVSMGKTTKELDKMFDDGKVTVQNIVDLGVHLEKKYGESAANILKSQMNSGERLKFELSKLSLALGPIFEGIGALFQNLASTVVEASTTMVKHVKKIIGIGLDNQINKLKGELSFWKEFLSIQEDLNTKLKSLGLKRGLEGTAGFEGTKNFVTALEKRIKNLKEVKVSGTEGKKQGEGLSKEEQRRLANFEKFKRNNEIERRFLEDKLNLGTKQAELNREIALMADTHGLDKIDVIKEELRKRDELNEKLESEVVTRGKINDMIEEQDQKLKDLVNPLNKVQAASDAIGTAFGEAVREVVKGTKSIGDAVASMLDRIADHFLQTAADMMAQQTSNWLFKTLASAIGGGISNGVSGGISGSTGLQDWMLETPAYPVALSSGGYVDRPTKGLIGEGGEGEYVIKESQMAGAMNRWSQGNRGKAVIHGSDGGVGSQQAGGSTELVVNYTGPSLVFNEQEYVPKSAVPEIINSAAKRGAEAGQSKVLSQLKNSRSQRSRIGL